MAQTTLLSQIDRSETYPKLVSVSAPNNNFYLTLNTDSWTQQMFAELPCIRFDVYIEKSGTYLKYQTVSACLGAYDPDHNNTDAWNFCQKFYDVPSDFYLSITPIFDNNAIEAHNALIENGIEEGTLWTTPTDTFDVEITSVTQGASPAPDPPTPPFPFPDDCRFTCTGDYFVDSAVIVEIGDRTFAKSTSEYAIGAIVHFVYNGQTYTAPFFASPISATAVSFTYNPNPLGSVIYNGVKWYYSNGANGLGGVLSGTGLPEYSTTMSAGYPQSEILQFLEDMDAENVIPTACPFTCDVSYFVNSKVSIPISNQTYSKVTDGYAIGVVIAVNVPGGTGICTGVMFMSPVSQDAVRYTPYHDSWNPNQGDKTVVYDGVTWYCANPGGAVLGDFRSGTYDIPVYPDVVEWHLDSITGVSEADILKVLAYVNAKNKS